MKLRLIQNCIIQTKYKLEPPKTAEYKTGTKPSKIWLDLDLTVFIRASSKLSGSYQVENHG